MQTPSTKSPTTSVHLAAEKLAEKADKQATRNAFQAFVGLFALLHFLGYLAITKEGVPGYLRHLWDIVLLLKSQPWLGLVLFAAIASLHHGIHLWRHRFDAPPERPLPEFPPVPDLRFTNDIYIGSAWTREGKQPGDVVGPDDEILDPHCILKEKGLVGNLHCKGGVGGGKTSTLIMPFIDQAIMKFPKPLPPEHFPLGANGRYENVDIEQVANREVPLKDRIFRRASAAEVLADVDPFDRSLWNPYVGMTPEEAKQEYIQLMRQHEENRWGMFIIDPKGDMTNFVMQSAIAAGRENDVIVLRPDGEFTYNPLFINTNPLVMAEMVMDGIEAVAGQSIQMYWRNTQGEWLANALTILKTVSPAKLNFRTILTMAREEGMRTRWVSEADAELRRFQEEEARMRRLGRAYQGPRVNPAAIEFFRDWDDEESDPQAKKAVVSGIKAQAKYFVDEELVDFLCPTLPPTFDGFEAVIDKGLICVLRMPLDIYGPVARVMGILMLADAQQAARQRINRPEINQTRLVAFVVDECSNYLNRLTRDFIAMNRQSRVVCLFAHQSQGQLIQQNDRSFETSFNDNLRTKISFSAPNAEAARRESSLYGSRRIEKHVYSESLSFSGVEHGPDVDSFAPKGNESKGASVRIDEVERAWFPPEDIIALKTGECIVSEFDGITTQPPRKVIAPALYASPRGQRILKLPVPESKLPPHPVIVMGSSAGDEDYLDAALTQTGFIFVESLFTERGIHAGLKFVTEAGTVIVSIEHLSAGRSFEIISDRLSDSQKAIVLADLEHTPLTLSDECGVTFERVLPLPLALNETRLEDGATLLSRLAPDAGRVTDFYGLVQTISGQALDYSRNGSWEYHAEFSDDRKRDIVRVGRKVLSMYARIGDTLYDLSVDQVEDLYDAMRSAVEDAVSQQRDSQITRRRLEARLSNLSDGGDEEIAEDTHPAETTENLDDDPFGASSDPPFSGDISVSEEDGPWNAGEDAPEAPNVGNDLMDDPFGDPFGAHEEAPFGPGAETSDAPLHSPNDDIAAEDPAAEAPSETPAPSEETQEPGLAEQLTLLGPQPSQKANKAARPKRPRKGRKEPDTTNPDLISIPLNITNDDIHELPWKRKSGDEADDPEHGRPDGDDSAGSDGDLEPEDPTA